MQPSGAILVSGIPGAGKTTVARLLAKRFSRSTHIEGDLVGHHFIVSGLVPPQGLPRDEAERQLRLRRRNIMLLADSFAEAGFLTVIDDVVISPDALETYASTLRARPLRFIQLTPALGVVRARDAARHKQVFEIWKHLDHEMRGWPVPRPGLWIDTSDMTAEETVEAIMADVDGADAALRSRRGSTAGTV